MNATNRLAVRAASCAAALLLSAGAWAEDFGARAAPVPAVGTSERVEFGQAVSDGELAAQSGGADLHLSEINARAVVSENYADHVASGNNTISDNAFRNAAGVPMVVQNTGHQVIIQNSTILNLKMD